MNSDAETRQLGEYALVLTNLGYRVETARRPETIGTLIQRRTLTVSRREERTIER